MSEFKTIHISYQWDVFMPVRYRAKVLDVSDAVLEEFPGLGLREYGQAVDDMAGMRWQDLTPHIREKIEAFFIEALAAKGHDD